MDNIGEALKSALDKGIEQLTDTYLQHAPAILRVGAAKGRLGMLTGCTRKGSGGDEVSVLLMHAPAGKFKTLMKLAHDPEHATLAMAVMEQIEREAGEDVIEGILRRYAEHHKVDVPESGDNLQPTSGSIH